MTRVLEEVVHFSSIISDGADKRILPKGWTELDFQQMLEARSFTESITVHRDWRILGVFVVTMKRYQLDFGGIECNRQIHLPLRYARRGINNQALVI